MKIQKVNKITQVKVVYDAGDKKPSVISKKLKIPLRTCQKYVKIIKEGKHNQQNGHGGQNKISISLKKKIMKQVYALKSPINIKKMASKNNISVVSLRNILRENDFTYGKLQSRNYTPIQIKARLQYCKMIQEKKSQSKLMLFTDETSFWINQSRPNYGWHKKGKINEGDDRFARNSLHSEKVYLWGGISSNGLLVYYLFEQNLTAEFYLKIIKQKQRQIYQSFKQKAIFVQDNDPKHKANKVQTYLNQQFREVIHLPPYSPDLNPIEKVWSWLKRQVAYDTPCTLQKLKNSIKKHCKKLSKPDIIPYIDNLNKVYKYIKSNKGQFYKQ